MIFPYLHSSLSYLLQWQAYQTTPYVRFSHQFHEDLNYPEDGNSNFSRNVGTYMNILLKPCSWIQKKNRSKLEMKEERNKRDKGKIRLAAKGECLLSAMLWNGPWDLASFYPARQTDHSFTFTKYPDYESVELFLRRRLCFISEPWQA